MSMIAAQMGEYMKNKIFDTTAPAFNSLGIQFTAEDVWNDLARVSNKQLVATFYIKGLDNVVRKDFNAAVDQLKQSNSTIKEFKVKFKRPEKEVRFFLELNEND